MNARVQQFVMLSACQAACLAVGLWVQSRLLIAVERMPAAPPASASAGQTDNAAAPRSLEWGLVFPLTFIWVIGLQALTAWLLTNRIHGQQSIKEQQSIEEALLTTRELIRTRDAVIFGLAKLAESRDPDTGHHLERIALYSTRLAQALRRRPRYRDVVTPQFCRMIGISSALHDIGKVGVEDAILLKPGALSDAERLRIQIHTTLGGECIRQIERRLGNSTFLQMAREIALFHHERWDGAGYPHGVSGESIPLAARIVAIADVYDALSVKRVYKDAYPHPVCVEKIRREAGRQFDPELVDVFLQIAPQFQEIAQRLNCEQPDPGLAPTEAAEDVVSARMTIDQERILTETLNVAGPARAIVASL
jgi:HD-GYP domain-containing protein (c-di-GMP phosphodiesterase class II)